MRRRLAALAAVLVMATGCGTDPEPPLDQFVIAAGAQGGVYEAVGAALADAARSRWSVDARVLVTAGAVENLNMVAEGGADVGFATVDTAALALDGEAPFRGALALSALASMYDDYLQVVVRADSGIRRLADLRGRRVSIGLVGSGSEILTARLLNLVGINRDRDIFASRLSATESAEALLAGRIDAFFFTGGLPTQAVAALAGQVPLRLLSVEAEVDLLQGRYGDYYVSRSIPAGMYALEADVVTVGISNVLVVRRDLPERVAYRLTELLFAARRELAAAHGEGRRIDQRSALATFPLPLHPGAQRYYRDAKPMAYGPRASCPAARRDLIRA